MSSHYASFDFIIEISPLTLRANQFELTLGQRFLNLKLLFLQKCALNKTQKVIVQRFYKKKLNQSILGTNPAADIGFRNPKKKFYMTQEIKK